MEVLQTFKLCMLERLLSMPFKKLPQVEILGVFYFFEAFALAELLFLKWIKTKGERKMKSLNVKVLVMIGMLSSISYILMFLNFPIPPFPNYLMIDFSDIPALIGAVALGPFAGILVEFLKNVLNYFNTGSQTGVPIGQLANFIAGILFILPTSFLFKKFKTKKGMTLSLILGTVTMAVIMSILNYYVILPAYTFFLNAPAMSAPVARKLVVTGILPFNLVKGGLMSVIFMLIFLRLQKWLSRQSAFKGI